MRVNDLLTNTKLRQAAEGWKQIFFRFAPFENFMMKLLYEYVDE